MNDKNKIDKRKNYNIDNISQDILYQDYIIQEMSQEDISKKYGISSSSVRKLLKKFKIPIRAKQRFTKELLEKEYLDNELSGYEIANKYNTDPSFICRLLRRFKIPIRGPKKCNIDENQLIEDYKNGLRYKDLTFKYDVSRVWIRELLYRYNILKKKPQNIFNPLHQKIGNLYVIEQAEKPKDSVYKVKHWKCLCDCGNIEVCATPRLKNQNPMCSECYRPHGELREIRDHFIRAKQRAKFKNQEFDTTIEEILDLFHKQNGFCALTGLPIVLKGKQENSASIDRIDSGKGYIKGNMQWIHKHVNNMKMEYPQNYYIEICSLVHKLHGEKDK